MAKKNKKGSWVVEVRVTCVVEVVCEDCTEAEARADPFGHLDSLVSETCVETEDWKVLSVEPNN